jgi:hypothetical protein
VADTIKAKIGQIGKKYEFTIVEDDGVTPVDLSGATVEWIIDGLPILACTLTAGEEANGRCDYILTGTEFVVSNIYQAALKVSNLPGPVTTFTETFEFVAEAIPTPA